MDDRLATIDMGRKAGAARPLSSGAAGGLCDLGLIRPQYTNVTDRQDRHGANGFTNGRPKTAEAIKAQFGIWTRVGPRKDILGGIGHKTGATWRIPLNRLCMCGGDAAC